MESFTQTAGLRSRLGNSQPSVCHSQLVQRKCACGGSAGVSGTCSECSRKKLLGQPYQTRLRINEPGDAYEQEADRVAARVMEMSERDSVSGVSPAGELVQRHITGNDFSNDHMPVLQRAAGESEPAPAEDTPKSGDTPSQKEEQGSSCPSWRADPESISKRVAETY